MFNETQQISLTIYTCMVAVYSIWLGICASLLLWTLSTAFCQTPPESTRLHQNLPESAGVCQSLLESARLHWISPDSTKFCWSLLESGGVQCVTFCHICHKFVTLCDTCWSLPESAGVRQSMWGSVKYWLSPMAVRLCRAMQGYTTAQSYAKSKNKTVLKYKERKTYVNQKKKITRNISTWNERNS